MMSWLVAPWCTAPAGPGGRIRVSARTSAGTGLPVSRGLLAEFRSVERLGPGRGRDRRARPRRGHPGLLECPGQGGLGIQHRLQPGLVGSVDGTTAEHPVEKPVGSVHRLLLRECARRRHPARPTLAAGGPVKFPGIPHPGDATLRRQLVLVCVVTREAAILDATADAVQTTRQEEFGQFMAARWPGLVRLAYGLTGDRWLAEDVAQAALASAYAAWWRVRRADDPDAYVRRILVNTSHRRFRRRRITEHAREPGELPDRAVADPCRPDRPALGAAVGAA